MKTTKSTDLFAFWKYDQYPYVLGARIVKMTDEGRVECEGYRGMLFNPIKVLPVIAGQKLREELENLERDYRLAQNKLAVAYDAKIPFELQHRKVK